MTIKTKEELFDSLFGETFAFNDLHNFMNNKPELYALTKEEYDSLKVMVEKENLNSSR